MKFKIDLFLACLFQFIKHLYLTYNFHTIESHEHIAVENCAIWIEFYVHFTQLQFNSKHAILGIGLWQNVIITTTLYENAYNFAFWLMLNLKSLQKARISDLQHTNKNFTEILPCDTFSW